MASRFLRARSLPESLIPLLTIFSVCCTPRPVTCSQGSENCPLDHMQTAICFHGTYKRNMVLTFLHGFKIIIRRRTFPDMWKAYAIPMSILINKVLLEQRQGHFVCLLSGCFHTRTKVSPCDRDCVAHGA